MSEHVQDQVHLIQIHIRFTLSILRTTGTFFHVKR